MVAILLGVIVFAIALVVILDRLGVPVRPYLRKLEWLRSRGAAVWWILLASLFVLTGVAPLQLAGAFILIYIAVVGYFLRGIDSDTIASSLRSGYRKVKP